MANRCYRLPDVLEKLQMSERDFYRKRRAGQLQFVEELLPRLGRIRRYRAEPIDRYCDGQLQAPRFFALARRR